MVLIIVARIKTAVDNIAKIENFSLKKRWPDITEFSVKIVTSSTGNSVLTALS